LLNTTLAGLLDSAIFFPTLNIGVILLSMICGVIFFKERILKKEITVLILGGVSILLLNFS
jgi:glucose uptake protein GlcU